MSFFQKFLLIPLLLIGVVGVCLIFAFLGRRRSKTPEDTTASSLTTPNISLLGKEFIWINKGDVSADTLYYSGGIDLIATFSGVEYKIIRNGDIVTDVIPLPNGTPLPEKERVLFVVVKGKRTGGAGGGGCKIYRCTDDFPESSCNVSDCMTGQPNCQEFSLDDPMGTYGAITEASDFCVESGQFVGEKSTSMCAYHTCYYNNVKYSLGDEVTILLPCKSVGNNSKPNDPCKGDLKYFAHEDKISGSISYMNETGVFDPVKSRKFRKIADTSSKTSSASGGKYFSIFDRRNKTNLVYTGDEDPLSFKLNTATSEAPPYVLGEDAERLFWVTPYLYNSFIQSLTRGGTVGIKYNTYNMDDSSSTSLKILFNFIVYMLTEKSPDYTTKFPVQTKTSLPGVLSPGFSDFENIFNTAEYILDNHKKLLKSLYLADGDILTNPTSQIILSSITSPNSEEEHILEQINISAYCILKWYINVGTISFPKRKPTVLDQKLLIDTFAAEKFHKIFSPRFFNVSSNFVRDFYINTFVPHLEENGISIPASIIDRINGGVDLLPLEYIAFKNTGSSTIDDPRKILDSERIFIIRYFQDVLLFDPNDIYTSVNINSYLRLNTDNSGSPDYKVRRTIFQFFVNFVNNNNFVDYAQFDTTKRNQIRLNDIKFYFNSIQSFEPISQNIDESLLYRTSDVKFENWQELYSNSSQIYGVKKDTDNTLKRRNLNIKFYIGDSSSDEKISFI